MSSEEKVQGHSGLQFWLHTKRLGITEEGLGDDRRNQPGNRVLQDHGGCKRFRLPPKRKVERASHIFNQGVIGLTKMKEHWGYVENRLRNARLKAGTPSTRWFEQFREK